MASYPKTEATLTKLPRDMRQKMRSRRRVRLDMVEVASRDHLGSYWTPVSGAGGGAIKYSSQYG